MSMPTPMKIVVISENAEIASIAAALLGSRNGDSTCPWIYAASLKRTFVKYDELNVFDDFVIHNDLVIKYNLLDARIIDYWLALDEQSEEAARRHVNLSRPLPLNFYHGPDTDTVLSCGFKTPSIPWNRENLFMWFDKLNENLKPWKERFWHELSESS